MGVKPRDACDGALGIDVGACVLRTLPDHFRGHRGRDPGGVEEEERVSVEEAHAVLLEFITAAYEGRAPSAVRVVESVLDPTLIGERVEESCKGLNSFAASPPVDLAK
jgi:hypothetical protein